MPASHPPPLPKARLASATASSRTFIGEIGRFQKGEKARLTAEAERADHVVAAIDAALTTVTGGVHGQDQWHRPVRKEEAIRAAMDRLLRGELPPGGRCNLKTLAAEAGVTRTGFYPKKGPRRHRPRRALPAPR
ncbi:hypothetical protein [Streptomyces spinosus]|uniref:hypothetical protein n=1 Tax=Streptomyces spinosus TaxID=2872623 RepID=UPI001CECA131|nr:hypothetical protein [Streptomyces spinosus]